MRPFAHLHSRTAYSARDGLAKLATMVDAAADDQPAVAATDRGSLGATWQMSGLCARAGTKKVVPAAPRRGGRWRGEGGDGGAIAD